MALRLSNKGRYGVRAMFDIAFHNRGRATQIKDIAERQSIPARFLEQIFQDLKRAGLVASKRGPKGGYRLARPAGDIRVGDVVRAIEGEVALSGPRQPTRVPGDPTGREVVEEAFREMGVKVEACFDALTLEDLCERGELRGVRRNPPHKYVYSI